MLFLDGSMRIAENWPEVRDLDVCEEEKKRQINRVSNRMDRDRNP